MSTGIFGSVRPANIDVYNDVDLYYYYRPTRGETSKNFKGFKKLDASECLIPSTIDDDNHTVLSGLFNLRLPLDKFANKGFYTVYITPKERKVPIVAVGSLAAYPDVKGVVFNLQNENLLGISDLTGYRLEFEDGTTRLVKSCNRAERVTTNNGKEINDGWNLVDTTSDLIFCTVSPSSAPSFKLNAAPYIGESGIEVKVTNTKFSPQIVEIEMIDHDADTISYMLEGDQANDRDHAIITTYNDKHEIYHQSDYYVLKDKLGNPLYNIKKKRENIDGNQDYDNIM